MSLAYYGLSFNPFDKQMVREKDRFLSHDMTEMTQRLDYLKDASLSFWLWMRPRIFPQES